MNIPAALRPTRLPDKRIPANPVDRRWRRRARIQGRALAAATLAASATQLRSAGSVGPGEVLLILVIGSTWALSRSRPGNALSTDTARAVWFLLVMSALGTMTNVFLFDRTELSALLGLAALGLLVAVMSFVATRPVPFVLLVEWAWFYGLLFIVTQSYLYAAIRLGLPAVVFEPLASGGRFQGWTSNPNQFAFLSVVAGAAVALEATRPWWLRGPFVFAAFVLAVASKSDGFRLAVLAAAAAVLATLATSPRRFAQPRQRVLSIVAMFAGFTILAYKWRTVVAVATGVADRRGQASIRFALWESCVAKAAEVPLAGLGPGAHARLPGSALRYECHNTFLGLATTSGVLGALALAALILVMLLRARRRNDASAVAAVTLISMMMMFGFFIRYPQLWLLLALIEFRLRKSSKVRRDPHGPQLTTTARQHGADSLPP